MNPQVIITGMHRSGTSLAGNILSYAGYYMGEESDMMKSNQYNLTGYFENQRVVDLNDKILEHFEGSWIDPFSFLKNYRTSEVFAQEIQTLITEFSRHNHFALKDPRFCLTLPEWIDFLDHPKMLVCVRHPDEVAQSILSRDHIPLQVSLSVREIYYSTLYEVLQNQEYFQLDYNLLLKDPEPVLKNLFTFLDLPEERIPGAIRLIHQGLKHHNAGERKWRTKSDPVLIKLDDQTFECVKNGERYHLHYEGEVQNIRFLNLPILIHSLEFLPAVNYSIGGYEGLDGRLIFLTPEDKVFIKNAPESLDISFVVEQWYEKAIWGLRYFKPNTADWKWNLSTITELDKSKNTVTLSTDFFIVLDFTIPNLVQFEWIPLNDAVIFEIMNRKDCPEEMIKIIEKHATWVSENCFYFFSPPQPIIFLRNLGVRIVSLNIRIISHGDAAKEEIFWLINTQYHIGRIEYHQTILKSQQNLEITQNQLLHTKQELDLTNNHLQSTKNQLLHTKQELDLTNNHLQSTKNQLNATLNSITFKTGRFILFPIQIFYRLYLTIRK
jgi:hypothetical protein